MKKLLVVGMVALALVLLGGCSVNLNVREQMVDSDFEKLQDGTLILSGNVDEDTYKEFLRHTSDGKKHYTLKIMTNGGCAYNTVAIMKRIELMKKEGVKFTMIVPGHGFSAGSFIFMMGDERIMYEGAILMWHTMTGQMESSGRIIPESRAKLIHDLDNYVVSMFKKQFPWIMDEYVDEILWNTGMTWMNANEARLMKIATKVM